MFKKYVKYTSSMCSLPSEWILMSLSEIAMKKSMDSNFKVVDSKPYQGEKDKKKKCY